MKKIVVIVSGIVIITGLLLSFLFYNGYIWFNNPSSDKFPIRGIDVSVYQNKIDWKELQKNNFRFIFIKATEGMDFKDKYFNDNWKNAKDIGLKRGAYHFFTFKSSGKDQAKNFIDSVPFNKDSLPPVIDIEFGGNSKAIPNREVFTKELRDFISSIEQYYKKKPMFYITYEAYNKYIIRDFVGYKIWIRDIFKYPKLKDNRDWNFWQYNSRGRINGINSFVDLNVFNGDDNDFDRLFLEN